MHWGEGHASLVSPLDFSNLTLHFYKPDYERFPLLSLAFSILKRRGSSAIAFNASDEIAVHAFLKGTISYPKMIEVVQRTLEHPWDEKVGSFEEILALDKRARNIARSYL